MVKSISCVCHTASIVPFQWAHIKFYRVVCMCNWAAATSSPTLTCSALNGFAVSTQACNRNSVSLPLLCLTTIKQRKEWCVFLHLMKLRSLLAILGWISRGDPQLYLRACSPGKVRSFWVHAGEVIWGHFHALQVSLRPWKSMCASRISMWCAH